jgi:hypothetical protein
MREIEVLGVEIVVTETNSNRIRVVMGDRC